MPEKNAINNKTSTNISPARFVVRKNITRKSARNLRSRAYSLVVRTRELEREIQIKRRSSGINKKQMTSKIRRDIKNKRIKARCLYAASAAIDDMISNGGSNMSPARIISQYRHKAADINGKFMQRAKDKVSLLGDGKMIRKAPIDQLGVCMLSSKPKEFGVMTAVWMLDSRYHGKEHGAKSLSGIDQSSTYSKFERMLFILDK